MGFIDYRGTGESHYEDVVEYAELQKEREQRERILRRHLEKFAVLMGDEKYLSFDAGAVLKQMRTEYRAVAELFRSLALKPADSRIEPSHLWKELWRYTIGRYLLAAGCREEEAEKLLRILLVKCFGLISGDAEQQHFQRLKASRRYRRHMRAFSFVQTGDFWKMLYVHGKTEGLQSTVSRFLEAYTRCITCMAYYLYLKTRSPSEEWEGALAQDRDAIEAQQRLLERSKHIPPSNLTDEKLKGGKMPAEDAEIGEKAARAGKTAFPETVVVCWERLADPAQEPPSQHTSCHVRELLFRRRIREQKEENEMIDDLYAYLKETRSDAERISTILPEQNVRQIQRGILPVFEDSSLSGLAPGEQIHYVDHGTLFWDEARVEEPFTKIKGVMVITDQRAAFRGVRSLDVRYEQLNRIIRYDMAPEILELECDQNSFYVAIPSMEAAYQALKLIANQRTGGNVPEEKTLIDYGSLVEKADVSACIFAYECLGTYDLPVELTQKISLLVKKLKGLKRALDSHPECTNETERFLSYYVPEGIWIIVSYYEQQRADLPARTMQPLYAKIKDSIDTLDAAVEKKILSIYQFETMDTAAKADALRQILEQDGYFKANQILIH